MLYFRRGKGFGKCVGNHIVSGTENKAQGAFLDDPSDEVKTDIDVLGTCVILMIFGERDC